MLLRVEFFACCYWLVAGAYKNFLKMAPQVASRLLGEILEALRASPDAAQLRSGLISSVRSPFFARTNLAKVDLSDPEYDLCPSARRPNFNSAFGINSRDMARNWVVSQIRTNVGGEQWTHARSLTKIADIFPCACSVMGNCRFLLSIPRETAGGRCDIWRLIGEQRMARNEVSFSGSSTE